MKKARFVAVAAVLVAAVVVGLAPVVAADPAIDIAALTPAALPSVVVPAILGGVDALAQQAIWGHARAAGARGSRRARAEAVADQRDQLRILQELVHRFE